MNVDVVHPSELGAEERKRWGEFQRGTPALGNPFLAPDFTIGVGRLRPQARVGVLHEGSDIVGFFPFERRHLGFGVPIAAGLTDAQGLVHVPGYTWSARDLLRRCGLDLWEFDRLVAAQDPFVSRNSFRAASPVMDLREGYDGYLTSLGARAASLTKDVRRKQGRLERDGGPVEFTVTSHDPEALRSLMSWKSAQYQRTGRPDRFASAWIVELVEQMLETRTDDFSCVLAVLRSGGRPVAAHVLLRLDDVLAGWFPAFDSSYYRCSPGTITRLRLAEVAAGSGVTRIEMGRGAKPYKELFKSYDAFVTEGRVTRHTPRGALHLAHRAPVRRLRKAVTETPRLYDLADDLLKRAAHTRSVLPSGEVRAERGPTSSPPARTARP